MANCTLTVDDVATIQKAARASGLSRSTFMQLFATPCFQQGLRGVASTGGALVHQHPTLNLEELPEMPSRAYGVRSTMGLSNNTAGVANWSYLRSKVRLVDPKDPLPEGWQHGNYALAEGLRLYGLFQPQWAWAKRSVPQVLLFQGTRFYLRSQMHEEHAKCYAVFVEKSDIWRIQAGYLGMEKYSEKTVIYKL